MEVIWGIIPEELGRTITDEAVPFSKVMATTVGDEISKVVNDVSFVMEVCGTLGEVSFCRAATDVNHTKEGARPTSTWYHGEETAPGPGNWWTLNAAKAKVSNIASNTRRNIRLLTSMEQC